MLRRKAVLKLTLLFATHLLAFPCLSLASGSYAGRPPRPPASESRTLYLIGKDIFTEKTVLKSITDAGDQTVELAQLQERLSKRTKSKVNIVEFSGKLTEQQMTGLKHYLAVRYKVK